MIGLLATPGLLRDLQEFGSSTLIAQQNGGQRQRTGIDPARRRHGQDGRQERAGSRRHHRAKDEPGQDADDRQALDGEDRSGPLPAEDVGYRGRRHRGSRSHRRAAFRSW